MKASRVLLFRSRKGSDSASGSHISASHLLLFIFTLLFILLLLTAGITYTLLSQALPPLSSFASYYTNNNEPTRFYDRSSEQLLLTLAYQNINGQDLRICEADDSLCFPSALIESVIGARDPDFRTHSGTYLFSHAATIAEEMVHDVFPQETGSDLFGSLRLRLLAAQVTQHFGREQILTWYLNNAWFGQYAFGVDAAAQTYLNKTASDMTDAESVLMSAIIASPALNPIDSEGAVRNSYLSQLDILEKEGVFSADEIEALRSTNFVIYEPPALADKGQVDIITQKALDTVYSELGQKTVERGGLSVITSEDKELQSWLNCVTRITTPEETDQCELSGSVNAEDAELTLDILTKAPVSVAVIDVESGELLAAIEAQGDAEEQRQANNALISRQSGSNMSIFAALYAFSMGYSPSSMFWDLDENNASLPEDYADSDGQTHGPVNLRNAVVNDYLRPLSTLLMDIGSNAVLNQASIFGLSTAGVSSKDELLLSGNKATTEDIAYALLPIASLGKQNGTDAGGSLHPVSLIEVRKADGTVLDLQPRAEKSIIDSALAYLVHNVLSEDEQAFKWLDRPAGTKLARIYGQGERWMSGYTPQITCSVRIGKENTETGFIGDDDRVEKAATVLWRSIMEQALSDKPVLGWERPENISQVRVCLPSGKLPTAACQETASEVFLTGNEPQEYDDLYVTRYVNKSNQLLATRLTPTDKLESKVFMDLPENAKSWAESAKIELAPSEYDPVPADSTDPLGLFEPEAFSVYKRSEADRKIEIKVNIPLDGPIKYYQISSGQGLFPEEWTERCLGENIEGGSWLLCSIDPASLEPGLYDLRVSIITDEQKFYSADTYVVIE